MLAAVQRFDTERPIVLITAYAHIALAIQAIREGDYDFIEKPFSAGADPRSMSPCPFACSGGATDPKCFRYHGAASSQTSS